MALMTPEGDTRPDVQRRLNSMRGYLVASLFCAIALMLLAAGLVAWAVDAGAHVMPAVFAAALVVATLAWAVVSVWRAVGGHGPATTALTAAEGDLQRLVAETAARLGVDAPASVVSTPVADVWLDLSAGRPTLVVGAPLVWELPVDTLRRVLAQANALLPELSPSAVRMLHVRARLQDADFQENQSPLIGALVRRFVAGYESRAGALEDACVTAASRRLQTADLLLTDEHHEQITLAQEAWGVLLARWADLAFRHGVAVTQLGRGMVDMLVDLRLGGLVPVTDAGEPLMSPSGTGRSLDERTSLLLAAAVDRADNRAITWEDYPQRVLAQEDRRQAAELFAAIDRTTGHTTPASMSTVIDVVENGWGDTLESVLQNSRESSDGDGDGQVSPVLPEHISAALTTLLVDTHKARRRLNWVHGQDLTDCDGEIVAFEAPVHQLIANRDARPIHVLLAGLGADPDEPVLLAGTEDQPDRVRSVIYGYRGLRQYHVVFSRDELLILRATFLASTWRNVVGARNPIVVAQQLLLGVKVADLLDTYPVIVRVPFTDVVAVDVKARWIYPSCRARVRTPTRRFTFRGFCYGGDLARLFTAAVGDRVRARRTDRSRLTRWWPSVTAAALAVCLSGGLVMLATSAFYGYTAASQPYPAYVTSCAPRPDAAKPWECAALIDAPVEDRVLRVRASTPYPTGTALDVRSVDLPVLPNVTTEAWFAKNMFTFWGACGAMTTVVSAFFLRKQVLRARRRPAPD